MNLTIPDLGRAQLLDSHYIIDSFVFIIYLRLLMLCHCKFALPDRCFLLFILNLGLNLCAILLATV